MAGRAGQRRLKTILKELGIGLSERQDFEYRSEIARKLTARCSNCYQRLPGEVGCSVMSPGWNWITPNFGPFCDDCMREAKAGCGGD